MARLHAAVAAHIEVPARIGGDDADVLALGFRTFAGAAGDAELHLVRGANALVAVLEEDPEADAVLHAEAAPGAADAGLGHAQRLGVGLTGLEARCQQLAPDGGQIILLGPEQADALGAGDLGVELVVAGHFGHRQQPFRGHLATGHARDDGVGPVLLHVAEEDVVGVLQRCVKRAQHVVVPAGGEDGADRRFAHLAAMALAMFGQQLVEALDPLHLDQVEQLLTGVGEVGAEVVVDLDALLHQFGVEHLTDERHAAAAAGTGLGVLLDGGQRGVTFGHRLGDVALGDVEAGADLGAFRQGIHPQGRLGTGVGGQDQGVRVARQRQGVEHHLQQVAVIFHVTHQHGAEQSAVVLAHHDLLVDAGLIVLEHIAVAARGAAVSIADGADGDAEQLELGAHVCPLKTAVAAEQVVDGDLGHLVARCHQPEEAALPGGALADGIDVGV